MAEKNLMTPGTASLSGLLGNGITYRVPVFQRDYSWKEENWLDLWEDIKILYGSNKDHYMGAIVLQKTGDKNFLVIDGQQRLTKLSLLALAVIKNIQDLIDSEIEAAANRERISELRRGFLGQRDPGSLLYSSKLFLNENNDSFYQARLLQLEPPNNEKILPDSDKLMWNAFKYLYNAVKELFKPNASGQILADFLSKTVGDKMMFIKIEVDDELSAYTLFETLNYRGVDFTVTDLLKNYLFSLLSSDDLRVAKEIWKKISNGIGIDKFPTFLRHYWISIYPLVRQEQLFRVIRIQIKTNKDVFDLLRHLENSSSLYVALQDPYNQEWQGNRERIKRIREMKLFGVKQQLPLLMAAKDKFSDQEYERLLRLVSVISFRYSVVGGRQANLMEDLYNKAAIKISNNEILTTNKVFDLLSTLYVSDRDFKYDFSTLAIYSYGKYKKLARYILFELENHLAASDRDYENDPATIEHILPENPSQEWDLFFPRAIQSNYIYRIGNYTLLESNLNRDSGDLLLDEKKEFYAKSQYQMPKKITAPEWLPNNVELRQQDMSGWATTCWRVSYAD